MPIITHINSIRFNIIKVLLVLTIIVVGGSLSVVAYTAGSFYKSLDDYSGQVARNDAIEARVGLERLKYFYGLNQRLPLFLRDLVSNNIFKNAKYCHAQFDYMTGVYEKAISDLKNESGYYAYQIAGNAKWRIAQDAYKRASVWSDPKLKKDQMDKAYEMASGTKDDYEKALRAKSNSHEASWNYELMTINGGAEMGNALQPKEGKTRVRLGLKGKGNKDGDGKDGRLGGEGTENFGEGGNKKGGRSPSNRRPG